MLVPTALVCAMWPMDIPGLHSRSAPARDYDSALSKLAGLETEDSLAIAPECATRLLTHGGPTRNVIVLLHGLTNCPMQFERLGEEFYAGGDNVLIVRLPHHGARDRMTTDLERMNAPEIARFTDDVVDVATGLGRHVVVVGLSLGGLAAAWAGQERPEVERAVCLAPLFGLAVVPAKLTAGIARWWLWRPNRFLWWNPLLKEDLPGPRQVYPRYATHAIAEGLLLGFAIRTRAALSRPAAREMVMVTVGSDLAVNNTLNAEVARDWLRHGAHVVRYEFPKSLGLNHDIVDPDQVGARPEIVYPILRHLIEP